MDSSQFNTLYNTQSSHSLTTGLRKLDLGGSSQGIPGQSTIGSSTMNPSPFYQTQNLNQNFPFHQQQNHLQSTQSNLINDDINQRTGPLTFGNSMNSFGVNGGNILNSAVLSSNNQHSNNILNQSIDTSTCSNAPNSAFHSPKHTNSNNYFKSGQSMMGQQAFQNSQRPVTNVFSYGAQVSTMGVGANNATGFNQMPNQIPNQFSSISSRQSDYQDTPLRQPNLMATPFSHQTQQSYQKSTNMIHDISQQHKGFKFNETLYDKPLLIRVKCQDREDFDQHLNVKIAVHAQSTTSQQQILTLELTDEFNPYFLYTLDCLESDFHHIKMKQQFLFDFQNFPHFIIEQLEKCQLCVKQNGDQQVPMQYRSNFCQFQPGLSNEGQLCFIEQNQYQSLIVLNLVLKQGNDESLKKYLAGKYHEHKQRGNQLHQELMDTKHLSEQQKLQNETFLMQINHLTDESKKIISQMKLEEEKRLHELREKTLIEQSEMQSRYEQEKRNMSQQYEQTLQEKEQLYSQREKQTMSMIEDLKNQSKDMQEKDQKRLNELLHQLNQEKENEKLMLNQMLNINVGQELENQNQDSSLTGVHLTAQLLMVERATEIKRLQEKLEKLTYEHNNALDIKRNLESENKERKAKIECLLHEVEVLSNQLKDLRDTNKGLDTHKFTQEKSITEYMLKHQALLRELEDKEQIIQKINSLLESTKTQKDIIEQNLANEQAKTAKMQQKLEFSKNELENAQKMIDKLKSDKKTLSSKAKTKNNVIMQQEAQIVQKQEQVDEQVKLCNEMRKEVERKDIEVRDLLSLNNTLKQKLEESQKSLESNAQMITWLNKQLNDKPGIGSSIYSGSTYKPPMSTSSIKPPVSGGASTLFKPTFASIEQLNSSSSTPNLGLGGSIGGAAGERSGTSYERSPFRNLTTTQNNLMNTPSSLSSNTSSVGNSFISQQSSTINLKNQAYEQKPPIQIQTNTTQAFNYTPSGLPTGLKSPQNNENVNSNLPFSQPQFVSKYSQQIYMQAQQDQLQQQTSQKPLITTNNNISSSITGMPSTLNNHQFQRSSSQSSISSGSSHNQSVYSSSTVSECNYGSSQMAPQQTLSGTMSFNPYQTKYSTLPPQQKLMESKVGMSTKLGGGMVLDDNNDTQMSGGDAFQAFLSKTDGEEDDDE